MKLITTRNIVILLIVIMTFLLVIHTLRKNYGVLPEAPPVPMSANVDLSLQNIQYSKTRAGQTLWTIVAESAKHLEAGNVLLEKVRMVFFDQEKGEIHLTADRGKLMPDNGTVSVSSNVVVVTPSGQTLRTAFLEYEENSSILQTNEEAQISTDDYIVTGKGMQINVEKRTLDLLSDVKGQLGGLNHHEATGSP